MTERWVPVKSPDEVRPGVVLRSAKRGIASVLVGNPMSGGGCPCLWRGNCGPRHYSPIGDARATIICATGDTANGIERLETGLDEAADRAEGKELYNGVPARKERVR